jgi:redox-sensitive bicupin YhaK (pirin superfamily)
LYHIQLEAGKQFSISVADKTEVAAFLPTQNIMLNDGEFHAGELVEFDTNAGEIEIRNKTKTTDDILFFGGEEYKKPVVPEGRFVMNTKAEIAEAYRNFFYAGKYGETKYKKQSAEVNWPTQ